MLIDSDSDDDLDYLTANMAEQFKAPPFKVLNLRVGKKNQEIKKSLET